jgi:hypothetical protein
MEGFKDNIPIEKYNIGELVWKGFIRYDQEKNREVFQSNSDLLLIRRGVDDYIIKQENQLTHTKPKPHKAIEF